jgi:DNA modification methylase
MKMVQSNLLNYKAAPKETLVFKHLKSVNNPNSAHAIYPYRGKISAIDARQILSQLIPGSLLLDPFCGSGTILHEAQHFGIRTIGIDNNPLAITLSMAKTQPIDVKETVEHSKQLVEKSKRVNLHFSAPETVSKYFHEKTMEQIIAMFSLKDEMSSYERAILYGAVCLSARACNHYKWTSSSVGKIITPQRYVDFYNVFMSKLIKHSKFVDGGERVQLIKEDARNISNLIPENSIDYVYTSPPYFDALDYTSYYARIIYELEGSDRLNIRKGLIQNTLTYEQDMKVVLSELRKVVKEGGQVIFVVGDKKMKDGTIINGGQFFSNLSHWKPDYIVEREYTGTTSQVWDKINNTKRKEQIVVWKN